MSTPKETRTIPPEARLRKIDKAIALQAGISATNGRTLFLDTSTPVDVSTKRENAVDRINNKTIYKLESLRKKILEPTLQAAQKLSEGAITLDEFKSTLTPQLIESTPAQVVFEPSTLDPDPHQESLPSSEEVIEAADQIIHENPVQLETPGLLETGHTQIEEILDKPQSVKPEEPLHVPTTLDVDSHVIIPGSSQTEVDNNILNPDEMLPLTNGMPQTEAEEKKKLLHIGGNMGKVFDNLSEDNFFTPTDEILKSIWPEIVSKSKRTNYYSVAIAQIKTRLRPKGFTVINIGERGQRADIIVPIGQEEAVREKFLQLQQDTEPTIPAPNRRVEREPETIEEKRAKLISKVEEWIENGHLRARYTSHDAWRVQHKNGSPSREFKDEVKRTVQKLDINPASYTRDEFIKVMIEINGLGEKKTDPIPNPEPTNEAEVSTLSKLEDIDAQIEQAQALDTVQSEAINEQSVKEHDLIEDLPAQIERTDIKTSEEKLTPEMIPDATEHWVLSAFLRSKMKELKALYPEITDEQTDAIDSIYREYLKDANPEGGFDTHFQLIKEKLDKILLNPDFAEEYIKDDESKKSISQLLTSVEGRTPSQLLDYLRDGDQPSKEIPKNDSKIEAKFDENNMIMGEEDNYAMASLLKSDRLKTLRIANKIDIAPPDRVRLDTMIRRLKANFETEGVATPNESDSAQMLINRLNQIARNKSEFTSQNDNSDARWMILRFFDKFTPEQISKMVVGLKDTYQLTAV